MMGIPLWYHRRIRFPRPRPDLLASGIVRSHTSYLGWPMFLTAPRVSKLRVLFRTPNGNLKRAKRLEGRTHRIIVPVLKVRPCGQGIVVRNTFIDVCDSNTSGVCLSAAGGDGEVKLQTCGFAHVQLGTCLLQCLGKSVNPKATTPHYANNHYIVLQNQHSIHSRVWGSLSCEFGVLHGGSTFRASVTTTQGYLWHSPAREMGARFSKNSK